MLMGAARSLATLVHVVSHHECDHGAADNNTQDDPRKVTVVGRRVASTRLATKVESARDNVEQIARRLVIRPRRARD